MGEAALFLISLLATCLDGQIKLLEGYSEMSGHVRIRDGNLSQDLLEK